MAMKLMTVEEFRRELERRNCRCLKTMADGYGIWQDDKDEVFSVPPPEEIGEGDLRYPDWMLDDLIDQVGLPEPGPSNH